MAGTLTEQVVDKGLGKNPQKSELIDGSAFCPGAPKRVPQTPRTSSHKCHSHMWRADMATGKTLKKTECVLRRSLIGG